ncbi:hypothetical protein C0Q58_16945 [Streptomyces albidoflavus]|uniref:Peptidase inhibitor family I36 n=2 Tax=Streptomyces TaxID=1883 RepID=A0AA37BZ31_9ACTN|nr:hypothetical protein CWI85_25815 [Streptomyces albidoflavus]RZD60522.1 hypothetical protein C0Q59_15700 [Streptomyces albidoflavus]RZD62131.1 hypothetical protein C0Q58_16945 [Streptomyces albidoflavus]RZE20150.1 hypothetical protein C0Q93_17020 [Streptomyces albidoflavus]RZE40346.1 hypothetical protein C0Q94_17040 [Streptomyces albidoflavus]
MSRYRPVVGSFIAAALSCVGVFASASAATADAGTTCGGKDPCMRFFYNSNRAGSYTYFRVNNVPDLAPYTYLASGAGKGQPVKNNGASLSNDTNKAVTVYYNSNYGGACDTVAAFSYVDRLNNTYNDNASFRWGVSESRCYKF